PRWRRLATWPDVQPDLFRMGAGRRTILCRAMAHTRILGAAALLSILVVAACGSKTMSTGTGGTAGSGAHSGSGAASGTGTAGNGGMGATGGSTGTLSFPDAGSGSGGKDAGDAGDAMAQVCGDGVIEGSEECDDGNTMSGDGCSAICTVEPWYTCPTPDQ